MPLKRFEVIRSLRHKAEHVQKGSILELDEDEGSTKDMIASGRVKETKAEPKKLAPVAPKLPAQPPQETNPNASKQ